MAYGIVQGINNPQRFMPSTPQVTGSTVVTAGRCYARYMGRSPVPLSSINQYVYVHGVAAVAGGGGASLNWAELGIATSTATDFFVTNLTLTPIGYTSIDAEVRTAATTCYRKTVTAAIPAGVDLWAIVAASYQTTQASLRTYNAEEVRGLTRFVVAQPSLVLNTGVVFVGTPGSTSASVWLDVEL